MKDEKDKAAVMRSGAGRSASSFILHPSSFLLGAFILFQLAYLPMANVIKLVPLDLPESKGELDDDIQLHGRAFAEPVQSVLDAVGVACLRWGELSGQAQGWSLFAPAFGHQAALPIVTATRIDPTTGQVKSETYRSRFEPADPARHFRWPESRCRLFNYEYRLALLYWVWSPEQFAEQPDAWRQAAMRRVQRQRRSMTEYMRRAAATADELVLSVRQIAGGAVQRDIPLARWSKANPTQIQAWDPIDRKWLNVPVGGEP